MKARECSLTTFMKVWKQKYSNVIIPKNHRFTECKTCSHLKAVLKGKPEEFGPNMSDEQKALAYREAVSILLKCISFACVSFVYVLDM